MAWPRIDGVRALELGTPGELREELNHLVLTGRKRGTAGLLSEYAEEAEPIEHLGERLALLDSSGGHVATVQVTEVEVVPFGDVPWSFAACTTSATDGSASFSRLAAYGIGTSLPVTRITGASR